MHHEESIRFLDEIMRAKIREDLVAMGGDVRQLIKSVGRELSIANDQLKLAQEFRGVALMGYQFEVWRLERKIEGYYETYDRVMEVISMLNFVGYRELSQQIRLLRNDTWHWFGFNNGRLPWRVRRRLGLAQIMLP